MKRMSIIRTVVLFGAMCFTLSAFGQQSSRDLQTQIDDLNKTMVKSLLAGDIESNLKLYTEDAISLPANEPMAEGVAAIRKSMEEMSKTGFKFVSFEPKTVKLIPEGNLVTEIGTYKLKFTMPGMEEPGEDHGKYLTIYEKQPDGSLKIKVETWNSDVNPMKEN